MDSDSDENSSNVSSSNGENLEKRYIEMRSKYEAAEKEIQHLSKCLASSQHMQATAEEICKEIEQEYDMAKENSSFKKEMQLLHKELCNLEAEAHELKEENKQLSQNNELMRLQLEEQRCVQRDLNAKLNSLKQREDELVKKLETISTEREKLLQRISEAGKVQLELESTTDALHMLQEIVNAEREKIGGMEAVKQELEERNKELVVALNMEKERKESLESSMHQSSVFDELSDATAESVAADESGGSTLYAELREEEVKRLKQELEELNAQLKSEEERQATARSKIKEKLAEICSCLKIQVAFEDELAALDSIMEYIKPKGATISTAKTLEFTDRQVDELTDQIKRLQVITEKQKNTLVKIRQNLEKQQQSAAESREQRRRRRMSERETGRFSLAATIRSLFQ